MHNIRKYIIQIQMSSLPTEIDVIQEKLLHNILDEGINEMRHGQFEPAEPIKTESPLIGVRQRETLAPQRSSALMQLIDEIKGGNNEVKDPGYCQPVGGNYASMHNELSFLQSKIKNLEDKLGSSTNTRNAENKENLISGGSRDSYTDLEKMDSSIRSTKRSRGRAVLRSSSTNKSRRLSHSSSSLRNSFNASVSRPGKAEDKVRALRQQLEEAKGLLVKERQKTFNLSKKLGKYEREFNMKKSVYEELRQLKEEYEQLKLSFDKSEQLRRHQKEIILELQDELSGCKESRVPKTKPKKKPKKSTK